MIGPSRAVWKEWTAWLQGESSLDFRLYNYTFEDMQRRMRQQAAHGVTIQWIIERNQFARTGDWFLALQKQFAWQPSFQLQADDNLHVEFQHAKTFVWEKHFIIQTANSTYSSFNANREAFFFGEDIGIVATLRALFSADWAGESLYSVKMDPDIVVCPVNCRSRVESLLQQAQQSIVMYEQYIDDPHIQSILVKKHAEGVNMRIILGASETGNSAATTQFLKTLSSSVKFQPKPYVHAKVILIDNQFLLIGSMNISATSLDKNREIGILLLDPKQIRTVLYPFEKDRAKSN